MRFTRQIRALDWLVARPIAHRGLHEEKARAGRELRKFIFEAAISHGYSIECDIQLTKEGPGRHLP